MRLSSERRERAALDRYRQFIITLPKAFLKKQLRLQSGAMAVDIPDDNKSYYIVCISAAQQGLLSKKITDANIELLTVLVLEFKAHETEIRKIRQRLETQIQRYKMNKLRQALNDAGPARA